MAPGNFDENNSTVRWIPGFIRDALGLSGEYRQPSYREGRDERRFAGESTVGWIPDPIRRWLGLDYDEPRRYGPSSSYSPPEEPRRYAPPPSSTYRQAPPPPPPPPASSSGTMRFSSTPSGAFESDSRAAAAPIPPPPVDGRVSPGANLPADAQLEGYVQPITFLMKGYARGALPPQGLGQFTKELRGTTQQLGDFYSYWFRFQTDELVKITRSVIEAVAPPKPGEPVTHVPVEVPVAPPMPPAPVQDLTEVKIDPTAVLPSDEKE